MSDEEHEFISEWFPEELSDEAAAAIYLFLEQFAQSFGQRYDHQINQHWKSCQEDAVWRLPLGKDDDQSLLREGDDTEF